MFSDLLVSDAKPCTQLPSFFVLTVAISVHVSCLFLTLAYMYNRLWWLCKANYSVDVHRKQQLIWANARRNPLTLRKLPPA